MAAEKAAEILRAGGLVALPTETVYGLAANALNAAAVEKIYQVKGRPSVNPIIVHVAGINGAKRCASAWPSAASLLAEAFWPGPLTIVLPKTEIIPPIVTAGGGTVGIRWPSHPFMQAVIHRCGFPLAAPSANLSNQVSPTTAGHVARTLGDKISLIVDAGPAAVGIESTVVDLSSGAPVLLRAGMISSAQLAGVLGSLKTPAAAEGAVLKSPGQLARHYSPRARLIVLDWENERHLKAQLQLHSIPPDRAHVIAHDKIPADCGCARVSLIPEDPEAYARALYSELHVSDDLGAEWIVVEQVPPTAEWEGIRDRLKRASAPR